MRAVNAGGSSGDSASDLATTVMFTDDPLSAGVPVKAIHLAELRTAVSAVRAQAGLGSATYTDPAIPGVTIKAIHITELRRTSTSNGGPRPHHRRLDRREPQRRRNRGDSSAADPESREIERAALWKTGSRDCNRKCL